MRVGAQGGHSGVQPRISPRLSPSVYLSTQLRADDAPRGSWTGSVKLPADGLTAGVPGTPTEEAVSAFLAGKLTGQTVNFCACHH